MAKKHLQLHVPVNYSSAKTNTKHVKWYVKADSLLKLLD